MSMFCLGVSGGTIVEAPCCPPIGAVTFTGNDSTCTVTVRWFRSDGTPISDAYSVQVALGAGQNYVIRGNIYPNNKLLAGQTYFLRITAQGTTVNVRYEPSSDMEIYNFRVSMWMQATGNEDGTYSVIIELGSESCWSTFGYLSEVASVTSSASETVRFSVQIARQVSSALSLADAVRRMLRRRRVSSVGASDAVRRALRRRHWSFASLLDTVITRALVSVRLSHSITSAITDYYRLSAGVRIVYSAVASSDGLLRRFLRAPVRDALASVDRTVRSVHRVRSSVQGTADAYVRLRQAWLAHLLTSGILDSYAVLRTARMLVASTAQSSDYLARRALKTVKEAVPPTDMIRRRALRRVASVQGIADILYVLRSQSLASLFTSGIMDYYRFGIFTSVASAVSLSDRTARALSRAIRSQSAPSDFLKKVLFRRGAEQLALADAVRMLRSVRLSFLIATSVTDMYLASYLRAVAHTFTLAVSDSYRAFIHVAVRSAIQSLDAVLRRLIVIVRSQVSQADLTRRLLVRRSTEVLAVSDAARVIASARLSYRLTSALADYYLLRTSRVFSYSVAVSMADYYRLWLHVAVRSFAQILDGTARSLMRSVRSASLQADSVRRLILRRIASAQAAADYVKLLRSARLAFSFSSGVSDYYVMLRSTVAICAFTSSVSDYYRLWLHVRVRSAVPVADAVLRQAFRTVRESQAAADIARRMLFRRSASVAALADYIKYLRSARVSHFFAAAVADMYRISATVFLSYAFVSAVADYYRAFIHVRVASVLVMSDRTFRAIGRSVKSLQFAADAAVRRLLRRLAEAQLVLDATVRSRSAALSFIVSPAVADIYFIQGIVGMVYEFRAGIVESYRVRTSFVQSVRIAAAVSDAYRFATAWRLTHRIAASIADMYRLSYTSYVVHVFATGIADYYRVLISQRIVFEFSASVADAYVLVRGVVASFRFSAALSDAYVFARAIFTSHLFRAGLADSYRAFITSYVVHAFTAGIADYYRALVSVRLAHRISSALSDYYAVQVFVPKVLAARISASIADYYMLKLPVMIAALFRAGVSDYYRLTVPVVAWLFRTGIADYYYLSAPRVIAFAVSVYMADAYQLFAAVARVFGIAWLFTTGLERCRQLVARANP